jgi:hypothetical protein
MPATEIPARDGVIVGAETDWAQLALPEQAARAAHRKETRAEVSEVAGALQRLFGRELTALMAGIQIARTVGQWARGESEPHAANENRLRMAYRVAVLLLEGGETERTVRSWFTGMNPHLGDRAPAQVIGDDPAAVLAAAKDLLLNP